MQTLNRHYTAFEQKRLARPDRQRAIGAGGKFKLALEGRVFMTLFALRLYPLPERVRKERIGSLEELPELRVLIDGTEQTIPRPKEKEARKRSYSGKKKHRTVKTQVGTRGAHRLVAGCGFGVCWQCAWQADVRGVGVQARFPNRVRAWTDKGYVGLEGVVPESWVVEQPKKKPHGCELSEAEEARNRAVNRVRVKVEHGILRMKRYQVLGGGQSWSFVWVWCGGAMSSGFSEPGADDGIWDGVYGVGCGGES